MSDILKEVVTMNGKNVVLAHHASPIANAGVPSAFIAELKAFLAGLG